MNDTDTILDNPCPFCFKDEYTNIIHDSCKLLYLKFIEDHFKENNLDMISSLLTEDHEDYFYFIMKEMKYKNKVIYSIPEETFMNVHKNILLSIFATFLHGIKGYTNITFVAESEIYFSHYVFISDQMILLVGVESNKKPNSINYVLKGEIPLSFYRIFLEYYPQL